jgi:transcriptional regulator with XRE-family HTH domain
MQRRNYHLTPLDRLAVRLLLLEGVSQREVARRLGVGLTAVAALAGGLEYLGDQPSALERVVLAEVGVQTSHPNLFALLREEARLLIASRTTAALAARSAARAATAAAPREHAHAV